MQAVLTHLLLAAEEDPLLFWRDFDFGLGRDSAELMASSFVGAVAGGSLNVASAIGCRGAGSQSRLSIGFWLLGDA